MKNKNPSGLDIRGLLLEKHIDYQRQQGKLVSVKEFAEYVGLSNAYFNHIYNKRRHPSKSIVDHFAKFFGDPRFYDVCGYERPDELQFTIAVLGDDIADADKKRINEILSKYKTDKIVEE